MKNGEIAKILLDIGEYLKMQEEPFRPKAYEKAGRVISDLEISVHDLYRDGGVKALGKISGVGVSIAEKIEEFLKTGRIKYYEDLKKKTPVDLETLTRVEGLGPQKIKVLYYKLKIRNIRDLEKAASSGRIAKLKGFGRKSEENILKGIEFIKKSGKRFTLGEVLPTAKDIEGRLSRVSGIEKIVIAGSVRRRKETIGDIDILAVSKKPEAIVSVFISMDEVGMVIAEGKTKASVKLNNGLDVDLRIVDRRSYGAALNYFTGSKEHNIKLRNIAIKKGYKLNEYGLFSAKKTLGSGEKSWRKIAGENEDGLYKKLGLNYIPPEIRENEGEIELSSQDKLPKLIGYEDLKGDLQIQTSWTDGADSIELMARQAIKMGLEYIAVTDHTKRLAMTNGLNERRIREQIREIEKLNLKFKTQNLKFRILKGTECDILKDGSLDLPDGILSKLDIVGASIHSYFNLSKRDQTDRLKKAMSNKNVDIIFHPTGRLINKRPAYEIDIEEIIEFAEKTKTVLEINSFPDRLDLRDEQIRMCVQKGVKMSIDSDAHSMGHMKYLEYGIAQARRGWAKKGDIINAWPIDKMLAFLKENKSK